MAIHSALLAVGEIAGAAAGGWVYQHYSAVHIFWLAALALMGATVIQLPMCVQAARERSAKMYGLTRPQ